MAYDSNTHVLYVTRSKKCTQTSKIIPYFLEFTNVGEAYLIFEKISVFPKVFSTNSPNRLKTLKCFAKH